MLLRTSQLIRWIYGAVLAGATLSQVIRYRSAQRAAGAQTPGKLRALFVHRDLPFHGGVPRCILYFARASDRERIDIHVGSLRSASAPMRGAFAELGILAQTIGDAGYLRPAWRMRCILRDKEIDVVIGTSFKAYLVAKLATLGTRTRVIFWIHAVHGAVEGKFRRYLFRKLSTHDPLMFVSKTVRAAHLPPEHMAAQAVVYNGVEDLADHPAYLPYPSDHRYSLGIGSDSVILAYIAEFTHWKDHATLLRAMDRLMEQGVDVHLLLMGTGELVEQMQATAKAGRAADRIHFLGARPDARRLLGLVDLYVHPSRGEGFGLAVVEAMLAKRPVIVSADGAPVEFVDAQVGLIFAPGDAEALANRIIELYDDLGAARALGKAGRERALRLFGIEPFADRVCDFLESALARPRWRASLKSRMVFPQTECAATPEAMS